MPAVAPDAPATAEPLTLAPPVGRGLVSLVVIGAVLLNLAGREFEELLRLPVYST